MRSLPEYADYKLTFFNNKFILYTVAFVFASGNLVILGFAGKTHDPRKIPRWWWPIIITIIILASFIYWAAMSITMIKTKRVDSHGNTKTIGDLIGFKVVVHYPDTAPRVIKDDIDEKLAAQIDGSQRRVMVETSGWFKKLGRIFNNIIEVLAKCLN